MRYLGLVIAFLFALTLYGFAAYGMMNMFIVGETKTKHTMEDYLHE